MEECAISVEDIENSLPMSRTEEPDCNIKLWQIENLNVKDENGHEYRFGDLYQKKKTIVIFIRVCLHFSIAVFHGNEVNTNVHPHISNAFIHP